MSVITVKLAGCGHLPGFSHCDMSDTPRTRCSALRPFSCLAFSPREPAFFSIPVPLWIFLLSKSSSLSWQSLYSWACMLTKATRTMNDVLCLCIAAHLTWPSTISGELSEHVMYLMTKQQGGLAKQKRQTKQHEVIKDSPAGGRMQVMWEKEEISYNWMQAHVRLIHTACVLFGSPSIPYILI